MRGFPDPGAEVGKSPEEVVGYSPPVTTWKTPLLPSPGGEGYAGTWKLHTPISLTPSAAADKDLEKMSRSCQKGRKVRGSGLFVASLIPHFPSGMQPLSLEQGKAEEPGPGRRHICV